MNRNKMYLYLKEIGMQPLNIHHKRHRYDKSYHIEYRADFNTHEELFEIVTDWGYIRGCYSIHLCRDEVVVESKYGDCKINIKYKKMKTFDVRLFELE